MKRKPRAPSGPRKRVAPNGARNPAVPDAPPRPATDRQRDIAQAIALLTADLQDIPHTALIGRRVGVSRQGIVPQLEALVAKGLVKRVPPRAEGWKLTDAGRALLEAHTDDPDGA